jgi:hypothetical protein
MWLRGVHDVSRSPKVVTDEIFTSSAAGKGISTPQPNKYEVIV